MYENNSGVFEWIEVSKTRGKAGLCFNKVVWQRRAAHAHINIRKHTHADTRQGPRQSCCSRTPTSALWNNACFISDAPSLSKMERWSACNAEATDHAVNSALVASKLSSGAQNPATEMEETGAQFVSSALSSGCHWALPQRQAVSD